MSLASVCQGYPSTGSCELEQPAFAVMDRQPCPLAVVVMARVSSGKLGQVRGRG